MSSTQETAAIAGPPRARKTGAADGRAQRALATRRSILEAATKLFGSRGVTASSIDDIADAAGIAKGSIYNNFGSKTDLVAHLIETEVAVLDGILADATEGLSGPAERRAIVGALLRAMQEHQDATRFIVSELFRTDRDWMASTDQWRDVTTRRVKASLIAELGEGRADECATRAAALVGAALVAGLDWLVHHPADPYERVLAAVLATLGLDAAS